MFWSQTPTQQMHKFGYPSENVIKTVNAFKINGWMITPDHLAMTRAIELCQQLMLT